MSAMPMFVEGSIVVCDEYDKTIGFIFVEPLGDPEGSQLQRWILLEVQKRYRFLPWQKEQGAPESLEAWKDMVTTPAPEDVTWGDAPSRGLWVDGAIYVVAQATPEIPAREMVPTPKFPRSQEVAAHTLAAAPSPQRPGRVPLQIAASVVPAKVPAPSGGKLPLGPLDLQDKPKSPTPQVIIGDYVLRQLGEERGYCFGDLVLEDHEKQSFFESSEYALLQPKYLGAGSAEAGTTSLDPGKEGYTKVSEFHEFVVKNFGDGSRYEVTGCNYYRGAAPPPEWFL